MTGNRIKGVHFHHLTEASSGSGWSWHGELCLLRGGRGQAGQTRGMDARFCYHLDCSRKAPRLNRRRLELATWRCRQDTWRKPQWQMWSSGLHPDRDQGLPRCQPLERDGWSLSTEPSLVRICNKYRLQPVSHLARILQGLSWYLSICKAVIGFWAASSASLHLSPDSSGIGWASTPEHDVGFNVSHLTANQIIYDCLPLLEFHDFVYLYFVSWKISRVANMKNTADTMNGMNHVRNIVIARGLLGSSFIHLIDLSTTL